MPSAGFLIYTGVMPLIKTFITIICGYILARLDLFPRAAARGASQVTMNIALPALMFANIVPAFTPSNVSALGPLFLIAFIYQALGFLAGLVVREICYVPRNFWQGIVVLTGMSNWGNLPNAVVLSVTQEAPFNPATDEALGVSYVSVFIVAYNLVFWVAGAAHSLSWDYRPEVPQGEAAERRVPWKAKPIGSLFARYVLREEPPNPFALPLEDDRKDEESLSGKALGSGNEKTRAATSETPCSQSGQACDAEAHVNPNPDPDVQLARKTSRLSAVAVNVSIAGPSLQRRTTSALGAGEDCPPVPPPTPALSIRGLKEEDTQSIGQRSATLNIPTLPQRLVRVFRPLSALVTPVTIALLVSLPIALVQPLKALFVDVSSTGGPDFKGPDGRPPLAFTIDTADFMGGITVPLALILLGASFARMKIPRPLSRLPLMAIFLTTVFKMVILPVVGIFLVQAMTSSGLVSKDAIALRFVMMFLSGTPSAVNQLIIASLYSPDGDVDILAACLLVQYIFMFFSSAALTAISIMLL